MPTDKRNWYISRESKDPEFPDIPCNIIDCKIDMPILDDYSLCIEKCYDYNGGRNGQ